MGTNIVTTETIEVGRIYLSPNGYHVLVTKVVMDLYEDPTVEYYLLKAPQFPTCLRPYAFQRGFIEVQ
jgi:hypothetical protein